VVRVRFPSPAPVPPR